MSLFPGARQIAITGGTHLAAAAGSNITINQAAQSGSGSAFQTLLATAAHTALHDSSARFDAPRCHRNTRTAYLDALEHWMLGHGGEYANARLIWLTGGAGVGKSAIMQSIVERCSQYVVILGTFFFSRADESRNYAEVLIPTLAYQLACAFPAAMAVLDPIIQRNPLIFKASLQTQAHELLVRPLLYLIETKVIDEDSPLRRVFVIDGLDECDNPQKQAQIIHVIATILCDNLPVPICFLIASRPEVAISRAFHRENRLHPILSSITLDDDTEAESDIRQFIEDGFLDILDTHPLRKLIPANWPCKESVDELVWKSTGHFIYAATAMKFISSTDEHPARALEVVEGLLPSRTGNPFGDLDALYLHILTSAKYSSQVLAILRHCVFTELDNSITAICFMYSDFSPEDVTLFLSDVQALVLMIPNSTSELFVFMKHASLSDFLIDANRSHLIYMSVDEYMAPFLPRYFQMLDIGPDFTRFSLFSDGDDFTFIHELSSAISLSTDIELLQSLILAHSPQDVWNFCMSMELSVSHNHAIGVSRQHKGFGLDSVYSYMVAIRDSAANHDNTVYIHQFRILLQMLLDDLDVVIQTEPQYRIIPALLFSSSPFWLTNLAPFLIDYFPQLQIHSAYRTLFWFLQPGKSIEGAIDPRYYEAIRSVPQAQLSWSSDLTIALELVLRHLLGYSWTPECLCPNPHERWLRQTKPLKYVSQGCPKLSSHFYLYLRRLPSPMDAFEAHESHEYSDTRMPIIWLRKSQCYILLKTILYYLPKSDCTRELAKLARRSLPKAALWFPGLMKRARATMDAYVLRWEDSLEGLSERTQSMSINQMD